ncbi:AAA family ATPase [Pseudaquabacterium rugosum]|uniref:AAA family ATPase n=1 Tax=Pseudaquabacterium rugosum TaxID=2984194 RepID=A0ABU9B5V3_9BURK
MPESALVIAIVGAESTGKTALARALAPRLAALSGRRAIWVPEALRSWCERQGRTPRADEQAQIAAAQQAAMAQAAIDHDIVVADTTPLMTAVYGLHYFGNEALVVPALSAQRDCALTLLTALDLGWHADPGVRDGPAAQQAVDGHLRSLLIGHGLRWSLVCGQGEARVEAAIDAVAPLLRQRWPHPAPLAPTDAHREAAADGLFSRLHARDATEARQRARWDAWCADCDQAECEHALRRPAG